MYIICIISLIRPRIIKKSHATIIKSQLDRNTIQPLTYMMIYKNYSL